jgi:hypothetical protein
MMKLQNKLQKQSKIIKIVIKSIETKFGKWKYWLGMKLKKKS